MNYLAFAWENRYALVLLLIILIWGKRLYYIYVHDPITGSDGKVQMNEIAKAILLIIAWRATEYEGKSIEQTYPEIFWVCILGAIALIAKLKHHIEYVSNYKKSDTRSNSGSAIGSSGHATDPRESQETS